VVVTYIHRMKNIKKVAEKRMAEWEFYIAGGHLYLSTSCYHDDHEYCQSDTGLAGAKTPAVCKFCKSPCTCDCHEEEVHGT
jgi:hypothetical protein